MSDGALNRKHTRCFFASKSSVAALKNEKEHNSLLSATPGTLAEWSIASPFRVEQHLDDVCLLLQLRRIGSDRLNPPTDKIVTLADPNTTFVGLL